MFMVLIIEEAYRESDEPSYMCMAETLTDITALPSFDYYEWTPEFADCGGLIWIVLQVG